MKIRVQNVMFPVAVMQVTHQKGIVIEPFIVRLSGRSSVLNSLTGS